jgi:hypothetical protein
VISVGGGRFARVGIGVCPGVSTPDPTPDFVAESFDTITAEDEFIFPANAMDELQLVLQASS